MKKPKQRKKGTEKAPRLIAVRLTESAIEALDQLCAARHIAPGRNQRARAVMALILEALIAQNAMRAAQELKEQSRMHARERRRLILSKLN